MSARSLEMSDKADPSSCVSFNFALTVLLQSRQSSLLLGKVLPDLVVMTQPSISNAAIRVDPAGDL